MFAFLATEQISKKRATTTTTQVTTNFCTLAENQTNTNFFHKNIFFLSFFSGPETVRYIDKKLLFEKSGGHVGKTFFSLTDVIDIVRHFKPFQPV
jgi:hypothetical protein